MTAALATAACAHGGDDDGIGPGDDGGSGGQDTSIAPPRPDGSTRDSAAPHDSSTAETASGDAAPEVGTNDSGGDDSTGVPDSQGGDDGGMDSGLPTQPDTGIDTGVDTGTDTGVPVHDAGTDTSTNLPSCAAAYDQSSCEGYTTGTTQVSSSSHNWLCLVNCQNCAATSDCAPGHSNCPWGNVWTDKGQCH
jgi:hypothetical protein